MKNTMKQNALIFLCATLVVNACADNAAAKKLVAAQQEVPVEQKKVEQQQPQQQAAPSASGSWASYLAGTAINTGVAGLIAYCAPKAYNWVRGIKPVDYAGLYKATMAKLLATEAQNVVLTGNQGVLVAGLSVANNVIAGGNAGMEVAKTGALAGVNALNTTNWFGNVPAQIAFAAKNEIIAGTTALQPMTAVTVNLAKEAAPAVVEAGAKVVAPVVTEAAKSWMIMNTLKAGVSASNAYLSGVHWLLPYGVYGVGAGIAAYALYNVYQKSLIPKGCKWVGSWFGSAGTVPLAVVPNEQQIKVEGLKAEYLALAEKAKKEMTELKSLRPTDATYKAMQTLLKSLSALGVDLSK